MGKKHSVAYKVLLLTIMSLTLVLSACGVGKRLKKVNVFPEWRDLRRITVVDGYVYAANGGAGLLILDASNPAEPVKIDLNNTIEKFVALWVAVEEHYAYVVDSNYGLQVIDISMLADPVVVGTYKSATPAIEVAIQPPYAYLATGKGGLHIIDISDPTSLEKVGVYDSGIFNSAIFLRGVKVLDKYAYVTLSNHRNEDFVEILDVSEPTMPVNVGAARVSFASGIDLKGDYVFVANYTGLQILDVSNPFSPSIITSYETPNSANTVKIEGDYAYIGDTFGVEVVDISDVHSPRQVAYSKLPQVQDVAVAGDYIYVADSHDGLVIFEHP